MFYTPYFINPQGQPVFFLRTNFTAANQSFSDTQVIRTTGQSMLDGALQINDLGAGTIGITSNALALAPSGGNNVTTYFGVIPRTKALAYQMRFSASNTAGQLIFGPMLYVNTAGSPSNPDAEINFARGCLDLLGTTVGYSTHGVSPLASVDSYTPGSVVEFAWVLGGLDSDGVPWDGESDDFDLNFLYGLSLYRWDGSTWTLIAKDPQTNNWPAGGVTPDNFANGPPLDFGFFIDAGGAATCSHQIIKDADNKAVFVPTFLLDNPSVGNTATGTADQVLAIGMTRPGSGNLDISFRMTDIDNRWFIRVDSAGDLKLFEVAAAVTTQRGSTAAAAVPSGSTVVTVYMQGQTITAFNFAMDASTTFGSASSNMTETGFEISDLGVGGIVAYAGSWPRTGYTGVLTQCTDYPTTDPRNSNSLTTTKVLTYVGDSLLDGNVAGLDRDNTPICMQNMLGGTWNGNVFTGAVWLINNRSVGGTGIADLVADLAPTMATFSNTKTANVLIIHSATKNIVDNPGDPVLVENTMKAYIAQVKAAAVTASITNLTIILDSVIDRKEVPWPGAGDAAQFAADRAVYNADMATWSASNGVTFINCDQDPRLTDSDDDRYFRAGGIYVPGVHLNYWGQGLLTRLHFNALEALRLTP